MNVYEIKMNEILNAERGGVNSVKFIDILKPEITCKDINGLLQSKDAIFFVRLNNYIKERILFLNLESR